MPKPASSGCFGITLERTQKRDFVLVILASLLMSLSSYLVIPLWFTPVPIVTQNAVVLLMAALLGARRGGVATFAYLAQGAMGLPVFAGGVGGVAKFLGPTGGYLLGYLIAAFVVGYIADRRKTMTSAVVAMIAGNGIIYLCGSIYLSTFVGLSKVFALGVAPFLIGDLIKTVVCLKILQWAGWRREESETR
ncbi:MAG: biotin transporter BioY [Verrucomicrobia bacterium]|nr:biotin transporter BioY [Verrucomicrobiota bacterium]MBU6445848.1 biotin transporter BioY [Verrucomicrobiota bacterium]MDE3047841.1 biotin transporter BioY [Verrucomicrobiota bacterium]